VTSFIFSGLSFIICYYRDASTFCYFCVAKVRRDNLSKHCAKEHRAPCRALLVGETPLKPRYRNWQKYIADPFRVFPEPDPDYDAAKKAGNKAAKKPQVENKDTE